MALVDTFCKTCIRILNFNICCTKSDVLTLELWQYSWLDIFVFLVSMDIWANVAILLMYGSHDMRHRYSAG